MKNLVQLNTLSSCSWCKTSGFFCYTPDGADYHTCPLCTTNDFLRSTKLQQYDEFYDEHCDDEWDNRIAFSYCASCKIMFDVGCVHAVNGCTSNVFNGHLISKWQDKTTMEVYTGMPQFASTDEWFERATDVHVMDMVCINTASNIGYCKHSSYPEYADKTFCHLSKHYPIGALRPSEGTKWSGDPSLAPVGIVARKGKEGVTYANPGVDTSSIEFPYAQDCIGLDPVLTDNRVDPVRLLLTNGPASTETSYQPHVHPFRNKFTPPEIDCIVENTKKYVFVLDWESYPAGLCACGGSWHGHDRTYRRCAANDPYRGPVPE